MINVVFDLSNMFHRSMFIVGGFGKNSFSYESQTEVDQLMRKVATDVAYALRQTNPGRVIFAIDAKSWRKGIEIVENEGYKGNREEKKSKVINWDNVYASMDEFTSIMNGLGLVSSRVKGAEADDLMCLWRDKLVFDKYENTILVSGDEDIRQLACSTPDNNGNKVWSLIFNPFTQGRNAKKKLFHTKGFVEWLEEDDDVGTIFNRDADPDKESFKALINTQVFPEEVDGNEIQLRKIFCGDDGDNVPAIYTWMGETSKGEPKQYRITKSTFKKILDYITPISLEINHSSMVDYLDLHSVADGIMVKLTEIAKHKPEIDINERLTRQIKLVILSREQFPTEIVEQFDAEVDEHLAKVPARVNGWYLNTLLAGTRYIDENYKRKQKEASIFQEIDKISQSLF